MKAAKLGYQSQLTLDLCRPSLSLGGKDSKQGVCTMAFELPDLPYAHDALADKGMSAETLEYHHDLHHNAYVVNGNKAIEGTEWAGKSMEDIIKGTYQAGAVAQNGIFNNISQLWNQTNFGI